MCVLSSRCSLHLNRQMAHGLQMAEIAQYKKQKAEKQQQEQLAKKKNWGNVMHCKKKCITLLAWLATLLIIGQTYVGEWTVSVQFVCIWLGLKCDTFKVTQEILATAWSSLSYKWESGTIALWAFSKKGLSQHICFPTSCWAVAGACLLVLKMMFCQ